MRKSDRLLGMTDPRLAALRVAVIYFAIGGAWILLSDRALSGIVQDATEIAWLQTAKGWVFVLATAVVLYMLVRRGLARIRQNEETFRSLVEDSLTGISIIQDGEIVYQNQEQARIFGELPRPLIWNDQSRLHPDDIERVRSFREKISSGKVRTLQTEFRFFPESTSHDRSHMRWAMCRANRIVYDGRDAFLVNVMDVTRARELERAVRVQDKMSSLGRVAAGLAHEIRNPLSGINIYLSTLKKIIDKAENLDKAPGILDQLFAASRKIESVIRRVMDFSKPTEPKFVMTDLNKPTSDAIELVAVTLRKSGISLVQDLHSNLPLCRLDAQMIEEVVLNLINNASEALRTAEGEKRIAVKSFMKDEKVRVVVSDSGPGIADECKRRVFDPFYTTKASGTGIGLSICHRIVTDHGGTLTVGDSEWGGASFELAISIDGENS